MSCETLQFVQKIGSETVDLQLALQCAPLLAGLKISNMLSICRKLYKNVTDILEDSGISYYILRETDKKIIMLLYNERQMESHFLRKDVRRFLGALGYTDFSINALLERFAKRYCDNIGNGEAFPHEMGVFLGYPLEDVKGFISNQGKNFLYSGYWKVYANMQQKVQIFQKFEYAREFMIMLISEGTGIKEIIEIFNYEELREAVV